GFEHLLVVLQGLMNQSFHEINLTDFFIVSTFFQSFQHIKCFVNFLLTDQYSDFEEFYLKIKRSNKQCSFNTIHRMTQFAKLKIQLNLLDPETYVVRVLPNCFPSYFPGICILMLIHVVVHQFLQRFLIQVNFITGLNHFFKLTDKLEDVKIIVRFTFHVNRGINKLVDCKYTKILSTTNNKREYFFVPALVLTLIVIT